MTRPGGPARSRLYLRKTPSPPGTIFEYLVAHFPHVPADVWRDRVRRGTVTTSQGEPVCEGSPYRHGLTVFYVKESLAEPDTAAAPVILYRDDNILVADKPHGVPVTPSGNHIRRSLLAQVQHATGLQEVSPAHRLDRDTRGLVLFTLRSAVRGPYQELFASRRIERHYLAHARVTHAPERTSWHAENRIVRGVPWFRQQVVEGPANAVTDIELIATREGGVGVFRLRPLTGRKHQLRLHMAGLGFPVLGDRYYPSLQADSGEPLQLLASALAFTDPLAGRSHEFHSTQRLDD